MSADTGGISMMFPSQQQTMAYTLRSADLRLQVTVYPDRPAYVYVTHEGLTEGEVDAALLELATQIPAPCCVVVLPACVAKLKIPHC